MSIVIGTTGILEEQERRITTYASIGIGLLAFCGLTIVSRLFQICSKKGEIEREFVPNEPRTLRRQQQISDNALSRDAILDEIEPLLGDTEDAMHYKYYLTPTTVL